jgi:hypothetical protein
MFILFFMQIIFQIDFIDIFICINDNNIFKFINKKYFMFVNIGCFDIIILLNLPLIYIDIDDLVVYRKIDLLFLLIIKYLIDKRELCILRLHNFLLIQQDDIGFKQRKLRSRYFQCFDLLWYIFDNRWIICYLITCAFP